MTVVANEDGLESRSSARVERNDGEEMLEAGSTSKPSDKNEEGMGVFHEENEELNPPKRKRPLDNNVYSTKKTFAQGMMDIALLTANASQLKMVLKHRNEKSDPLFALQMTCLSLSIILQIFVGVLLIVNSRYNINRASHQPRADFLNNATVIGIFLITMVNVLASTLGDYA